MYQVGEIIVSGWGQVVIAAAAVVTALGILWKKVLKPGALLISTVDKMIPLMNELTIQMADSPDAFAVLKDIAKQFKSDSGSSLRDVVNRLESAANDNRVAAEVLKVQVEVARQLAVQDRKQMDRMMTLLNYLDAKMTIGSATAKRQEDATAGVAADLTLMHERAEAMEGDTPGEAADRAVQLPPNFAEERRRENLPIGHPDRRRVH